MHRPWITSLVGAALILSATTVPASAAPPPGAPAPADTATTARTARITLITGDRVRVTSRPGAPELVTFEPSPDSRSTAAITTYSGGHTYVVPAAAAADVASGRLDRTLFDITTLVAEGRDDTSSTTLPVIIRYAGSAATALGRARQTPVPGAAKSRVLTSIGARAAAVSKSGTDDFWRVVAPGTTARVAGSIERVSLDRRVRVDLDQSVPQIGAPAAWQRGLTGKGVTIAVLDTGIDPAHPDFAGRITRSENFSEAADTVDHFGHGTHVAGIAAGSGAASGGRHKGVAPEANLLNGKVLDDSGSGSFSGVIAGMEWAAAQGADVVNLSLGSQDPSDGTDDVSQAVNRLSRDTGTLFVVAAGNCFFPQPATVTSPAAADDALAVGNLKRDGSLNESSCRGPRKGDGALKPEISAPGTDIVAAKAADAVIGDPVGDHYTTLTGTSMASPHVAGAAALVAQAHPDWKAEQLKARLISTADPQQARVDEEGAGRVDADQATEAGVTVDTGELELGKLTWPYPAEDKVSRELTYRNPTGTAVTLQLAATLEPAQATPTLSATQLVVPANGTATVTVTADRAAAGTGYFSGRVTATAAGADPIVTTIGWYAEPELYDLTIKGIARDGSPANADISISRLDGEPVDVGPFGLPMRNGVATLRLPPGRYLASSTFSLDATDTAPQRFDLVTSGETQLAKDTTVTLDARRAAPVDLTVRNGQALTARERSMAFTVRTAEGLMSGGTGVSTTGAARIFGATPTAKPSVGSAEFAVGNRLEVPPYRAGVAGGSAFTVLDFYFGPRFTGVKDLPLFDAGTATPEELAGVQGKLALIRAGNDEPRYNGELVKAAQDAGAAAAALYNPDRPGDGGVFAFWATGEGPTATIPAMRTSRAAAQALLDRLKTQPVTVRVTGQAATPVIYDLVRPWASGIPADPRMVVRPEQLATVSETFGAHRRGMATSETRHATTPGFNQFGGWLAPTFDTPVRRTSYVLANRTRWSSFLVLDNGGENLGLHSTERIHRPGERSSVRWLAPVQTSGLPPAPTPLGGVKRLEGGLLVQVSPFLQGEQFADTINNPDSRLTLFRNGEQVASEADTALWTEVPADAADYRMTLDTRRDSENWRYSTQVRSTWTFKARGGTDEVMPLVFASVDVPQANALSQVQVGTPTTVAVNLYHQPGTDSAAPITEAKLELSYDGKQWTNLPLLRTGDGKYAATLTHPVDRAGQAPSLRITGSDAEGNKLEQEVTRAYGLRR
ncbi:peptidase S8 and S53 subtilisin kexin sedolisin [Kribbella flavida DSM 17836]|uniref:Peptidase S8 and S53 subtilisin kexin sedolisin n=1 Tax=Kribbella flavida (strain DSM 17836 / JCM 10339 / NBRC 14399) TaxID=479435 RepID=D2Q151_KRIFD|nr:S8 family serine peptidase [Kribbella flavida]ADB35752.1 peptidase S8 and S53 subtilisin kexin sedolisin [Kribbella flavida DSM 17836]